MKFNYKFENKKGMMPYKYDNGKIYKLVSSETDDVYIGSTCGRLCERLWKHKAEYNSQRVNLKSFDLTKYPDCKIELIEDYPCNNIIELRKREGYYQLNTPHCINELIAGRTKKEQYEDNKERILSDCKKRYHKNFDKYNIARKKYRDENKERQKIWHKEWVEKNLEAERKRKKEYYLKTKHLKQATINCECGGTYRSNSGSKNRHEKTKKHQNYLL